jgi:DNA-binding beta-propeller fold protein YncE
MKPSLAVHDVSSMKEISRVEVADAWLGMAFAPKSNRLYVSGGSRSEVYEFELSAEGALRILRTFPLVDAAARKHTDFAGDLTVSPDGRLIYIAALYRDSVWVVNPQSGVVIEEWKTGHRPYRILFHPDGKSYFVTGWGDGMLYRHNSVNGERIARIAVGPAPMDLAWRDTPTLNSEGEDAKIPARLFVAVSNTNTVAVFSIGESPEPKLIERINVTLQPRQPAGMTPTSLAFSGDQSSLYVVCADANATAVVNVKTTTSVVEGFFPTGWYPTSVREMPDRSLLVLNGRGPRSYPNPAGPNPTKRTAPVHLGNTGVEYVGVLQKGSASHIPPFDIEKLDEHSAAVLAGTPYRDRMMEDAEIPQGNPVPSHIGDASPVKHVIYIVKENRTYDQVLGDLGIGNGDPNLTLFGEDVSPNHHKLAREFVLLDNFYVNADVSADGHNWSSAAIAPAYVQRMWPNSYASRRRHYDYEGGERAALPPAGYIWNNALSRSVSIRNYGFWVNNINPPPASGAHIQSVRDPALKEHTNFGFRGFDLNYKDVDRVPVFLADLKRFEQEDSMPRLILMRIGNDHTSGTSPKKYTPKAAMADNDAALGMIVEAVSKSKFWPETAIFVLQDDAQNGPDHVDSHRSPAYLISPYTRGRGIDSTMYNTVSMLRTMELILGMRPMTMHDAGARPMWAAFNRQADLRTYQAEKPRISLDDRNPDLNPTAARSLKLDFEEADRIDDDELNDILWRAIRGGEPPVPTRSFFGR